MNDSLNRCVGSKVRSESNCLSMLMTVSFLAARGEVVALRETDASDAQRPSTPRNDSSKATTPTSGVMGQLTPSKIGAASSSPAQPRGTNSGVKTNGGKKVDSTELIAEMLNYSPITINPRLRTESGSSSGKSGRIGEHDLTRNTTQ